MERISTISNVENDYNATYSGGRLAIWKRGVEAFVHRPIGYGLGNYHVADGAMGGTFRAAHNVVMQLLVELGLVGLVSYVSIYVVSWRGLVTIRRSLELKRSDSRVVDTGNLQFLGGLVSAVLASIVGFWSCGLFLSAAYAPITFILISFSVLAAHHGMMSVSEGTPKRGAVVDI